MSGMWLVNGKVTNDAGRDKVWVAYNNRLERLYREEHAMQERHLREAEEIDLRIKAARKLEPFTPWVGHDKKSIRKDFVERGLQDWKRRKETKSDED